MHDDAVRTLTDDTFRAALAATGERPLLVEFTAAWCPPCRAMQPILAAIARARDDVDVAAVDVDASPDVAAQYGVRAMPTFLVFLAGHPVAQSTGAQPRAKLEALLAPHVRAGARVA